MRKFLLKIILLVTFFCCSCLVVSAQSKTTIESPFYLGLKGGANVSHVMVLEQFQIFSSIGDVDASSKEYNKIYQNWGYQYGFVGLYKLSDRINLIFEPTFAHYRFGYSTENIWVDTENEGVSRSSEQEHNNNLHYLELPLLLQFTKDISPVKPYFLVGGYYGRLLGAEKLMHVTEITTIDEQDFTTSSEDQHLFYNDQYIKSRLAAVAEIGAIYDLENLQLMLGVGYHYSFNNISREDARYSNQLITGSSYDVNDNMLLNSVVLNLRVLFPLNKPSSLAKSLKCKQ